MYGRALAGLARSTTCSPPSWLKPVIFLQLVGSDADGTHAVATLGSPDRYRRRCSRATALTSRVAHDPAVSASTSTTPPSRTWLVPAAWLLFRWTGLPVLTGLRRSLGRIADALIVALSHVHGQLPAHAWFVERNARLTAAAGLQSSRPSQTATASPLCTSSRRRGPRPFCPERCSVPTPRASMWSCHR